MQILTPSGFQKFDGINRTKHSECLKFTFDDGTSFKTSLKHKFIIKGEERYALNISIGDNIGKVVTNIDHIKSEENFFDPLNVENGSVYNHDNNFISHNSFLGTGNTLINGNVLLGLKSQDPISINHNVSIYFDPIEDHEYLMLVDVSKGRGQDYSTFNIIDITGEIFKQVAVYRDNTISPILFPDIINKYGNMFNEAYVIIESNDAGQVVCNGLYYDIEYENVYVESAVKAGAIGVTMTKKVKRIGCSNIKDIIEQGKLEVVDANTIYEMSSFVSKGNSFQADKGLHDDLMMNLVLFGWFTSTAFFKELSDIDMKQLLYAERVKHMEDDLVPFGIINDGTNSDEDLFIDNGLHVTTWQP